MFRVYAAALLAVGAVTWSGAAPAQASHPAPVVKGIPPIPGVTAHPNAITPDAATSYHYVYDRADGVATGGSGSYVVADPAVPPPDVHSLAELAVESDDGEQIVEEGWTVDPGQFGDNFAHLFVFHWVDGVAACYNGCGFVATSTSVTAGMQLTTGSTHVFKINFSNHRWNISDNGEHLGYFPESLWSGDYTEAGHTQWFGEVAASGSPPCAQMGNGLFATDPNATSITAMTLIGGAPVSATPTKTDPADYKGVATAGNAMRFGGPGGCGPQPQVISFETGVPIAAVVGGKPYTPAAIGGASGNPVAFSIAAASASVCGLDAGVVSFIGVGKCVLNADQAGNAAYTAAPQNSQTFQVRMAQSIAFTSKAPKHAKVGGPHYRLKVAHGGSGKPVTFSVGRHTQSVCKVRKKHATFVGAGTCNIHANEVGNKTYAPAHQISQKFTVHKH